MAREDLRRHIAGLHATRLGATAVSIYATVRSNYNVHERGILMPPGITRCSQEVAQSVTNTV